MSEYGEYRRTLILEALRKRPEMTEVEIGAAVGLSSTASVHAHVKRLERDGLIRRARGWRLT